MGNPSSILNNHRKSSLSAFIFFLLFVFFSFNSFCQNVQEADSLLKEISKYDSQKKSDKISLADTNKVNLLLKLWNVYAYNDYKKALTYSQQAKDLALKTKGDYCIARTSIYLGISYDNIGDYSGALHAYNEAEVYYKKLNDKPGLTDAYFNTSTIYAKTGNYTEALRLLQISVKLALELKDEYRIGCAYSNLGVNYKQQGNYDEALKNYKLAQEHFQRGNEQGGIAATLVNIGEAYFFQKKHELAIQSEREAIAIAEELADIYLSSSAYHSLGMAFYENGMNDSALFYFEKSLNLRVKMEDQNGIANTLIEAGKAYYKSGINNKAEEDILKGIAIADKIGALEFKRNGFEQLAKIANDKKEFKKAYDYQVLYKEADDSLLNIEKTKALSNLILSFQLEKERDSVSSQYERKMAVMSSENNSKAKTRNYIIAGMLIIVCLLVVTIVLRRKLEVARKQKTLEQERTRISRDLHDDLGSGITSIMMMSEQMKLKSGSSHIDPALQKIQTTSRQMVDQMGEIIWAMNSTNNSLANLLSYIREYVGNLLEESSIRLDIHYPLEIPETELNGIIRRNIFLVIKETINNTLKYADASAITMYFKVENKTGIFRIADNGKGFDTDSTRKFGNGLKNMQARMDNIGGTLRIESVTGAGTETEFSFPFKS